MLWIIHSEYENYAIHCTSYHYPPTRAGSTSSTCWRTMRPASPSLSLSSLRPLQSAGSMDSGSTFQSLPFTILLQELLRGRVCHARQQTRCLSYSNTLSFPSRVDQDLGKLIEFCGFVYGGSALSFRSLPFGQQIIWIFVCKWFCSEWCTTKG